MRVPNFLLCIVMSFMIGILIYGVKRLLFLPAPTPVNKLDSTIVEKDSGNKKLNRHKQRKKSSKKHDDFFLGHARNSLPSANCPDELRYWYQPKQNDYISNPISSQPGMSEHREIPFTVRAIQMPVYTPDGVRVKTIVSRELHEQTSCKDNVKHHSWSLICHYYS